MREGTLKEITPSSVGKTYKGENRGRSRVSSQEREWGKWREIKNQFTVSRESDYQHLWYLIPHSFQVTEGKQVIIRRRCSVMNLPLTY